MQKLVREFFYAYLKSMLYEKFKQVDFQLAKDDVIEFINDKRKIEIWSSEFFYDVTEAIFNANII